MGRDLISEFQQQKSVFKKKCIIENMFFYANKIELNNKMKKNLSKLVKFIVQFNFFFV